MVKPGLQVMAFAPGQFDQDGNLTDEKTKELLMTHLDALVTWTRQIVRPHEFIRYACDMDVVGASR